MGVHFPAVELDSVIQFSILFSMSWFLWNSSKWACRFGHFLQYMSGPEVLACSLDTNINYDYNAPTASFPEPLSKVAATFSGEI